jgi:MFS family permease
MAVASLLGRSAAWSARRPLAITVKLRGYVGSPSSAGVQVNADAPLEQDADATPHIVQVITAVTYCLLAAGITFGYAALKPVLIREHVYRELCTEDELRRNVRTCVDQEIRLNLIFTVAAVGMNMASLPVGAILDKFGPRVCGIISSSLVGLGALLFAFAGQLPFDGYIPAYLFLGLGGSFLYISSFQLSNAFPKHSGLILAAINGAFDASSALFLVYRLLYNWSNDALRPKDFFLVYLAVPLAIFLAQIFLMPKVSYETVAQLVERAEEIDDTFEGPARDRTDENTALLFDANEQHRPSVVSDITDLMGSKSGAQRLERENRKNMISGVWGVMHGKNLQQQLLSPWFILIMLFTAIQMTRINYFIATIRPQYQYLLHSYDKAVKVNHLFDILLPLGGIFSIPLSGLMLDNTSTFTVLSVLISTATIIGILGCLPYTWAAYVNVSLFVVLRPFYYTAISDYVAKVFGFGTFGTIYGAIICLAGLVNLSQSGLDALLHKVYDGNPVPINLILLVTCFLIGSALCIFIATKAYQIRRERLEEEAECATETIMPGAQSPQRL